MSVEFDDGEVIQFTFTDFLGMCSFVNSLMGINSHFLLSEFDCMHSSIQFARELGNQLDGGRISVLRVGQGGV
jgi:hypothetical protein